MLPNDAALFTFTGMAQPVGATDSVHALQRLEVTAGCAVRLEQYFGQWIRLDIERPTPPRSPPCTMSGFLLMAATDSTGWTTLEIPSRQITLDAPATLIFRPAYPLHLRNVPVSELRFETNDTGFVRSAILGARLELSDVGDVRDKAPTAHVGDAVTLGELEGRVAEIVVRDTIRTVFKGTASRPAIARHDLRPTWLEYLGHTRGRLALAFALATAGFVALILPKGK
jgi:hypothetical protein